MWTSILETGWVTRLGFRLQARARMDRYLDSAKRTCGSTKTIGLNT